MKTSAFTRFSVFIFAVILGMVTEVCVDFLKCIAAKSRAVLISPELHELPPFVCYIFFFVFILVAALLVAEKIMDPEKKIVLRQRITFIAAFIAAVFLSGFFYPFPC
ncbi:MAG: hypothetical protein ACRD2U_10285 [Terriglobales bacterium]